MPTIIEGLTQAAQDLRDAVAAVLGLRTELRAEIDAGLAANRQIVADAVPLLKQWVVDPVSGSDGTGDGRTVATAYKTLEKVFQQAAPATEHLIFITGDIEHQYYSSIMANVAIRGSTKAPGTDGYMLATAKRKITFRPEALNSPLAGGTRATSGFVSNNNIDFNACDIYIADTPAGVTAVAHILGNPRVSINNGDIFATTPGNAGRLVAFGTAVPPAFYFYGAIAAAAQGRLFANVAAGADPNATKRYVTNLTAN